MAFYTCEYLGDSDDQRQNDLIAVTCEETGEEILVNGQQARALAMFVEGGYDDRMPPRATAVRIEAKDAAYWDLAELMGVDENKLFDFILDRSGAYPKTGAYVSRGFGPTGLVYSPLTQARIAAEFLDSQGRAAKVYVDSLVLSTTASERWLTETELLGIVDDLSRAVEDGVRKGRESARRDLELRVERLEGSLDLQRERCAELEQALEEAEGRAGQGKAKDRCGKVRGRERDRKKPKAAPKEPARAPEKGPKKGRRKRG